MLSKSILFLLILVCIRSNADEAISNTDIKTLVEGGATVKYRSAGKAANWNEARSNCKALGSTWDLPDPVQFLFLAMGGQAVQIRSVDAYPTPFDSGSETIHALWSRGDDEAHSKKVFEGHSLLVCMQDGKGMDTQLLDLSADAVQKMEARLKYWETALEERDIVRTDQEEETVRKAAEDFHKAHPEMWLNMGLPHEGVFTPEVNKILKKTSVAAGRENAARYKALLAAGSGGFPVVCTEGSMLEK